MKYVDFALARLRENGERITANRRRLVEIMALVERPVSPYDLETLLRSRGENVLAVSIYRALEPLERLGLVHRLAFTGGYLPCRLPDSLGCHHHLTCRACGSVEEVPCPGLAAQESLVSTASGYRVEAHVAEFNGLCRTCQVIGSDAKAPGRV